MLRENIAVITGHSSGIGKAIADLLKKEGVFSPMGMWSIVGISKSDVDLSKRRNYYTAVRRIHKRIGRRKVDLLVNNAGALRFNENFIELELLKLNFLSPFMIAKNLRIKNGGNIINIASTSGIEASPEEPMYGAAKAAMIHMTKSFAKLYAPKRIRVNCISPGFTNTNLVPGRLPKHLRELVPLKREIQPKEIANIVFYILTSPSLTGANIVVDGGLTA